MLICILSGEPSGDVLGARLMDAFGRAQPNVSFMGVGGELMAERGLTSLVDQGNLAVMGLVEVLSKAPEVLRGIRRTVSEIGRCQPDAVVTIDSWGFAKRVHKALKTAHPNIPRIHYVAPMVWAWGRRRARSVARLVDHLLCLWPNEPPYFERYGLACSHVGHAVFEDSLHRGDGIAFRKRHCVGDDVTVLTVLPGSRMMEVRRLLPVFKETVSRLFAADKTLRVVIPTVAPVADYVRMQTKLWPMPVAVVMGEKERLDAFAASRAALAASGTVSLELALASTPHVIAYKCNTLTAWIFLLLKRLTFVNLLNIAAGFEGVPERLGRRCRADYLVDDLTPLIRTQMVRMAQRAFFQKALHSLRAEGSPSDLAARSILNTVAASERRS